MRPSFVTQLGLEAAAHDLEKQRWSAEQSIKAKAQALERKKQRKRKKAHQPVRGSFLTGPSWTLYFDGACTVNPGGHATYGWLLYNPAGVHTMQGCGYLCSGKGATCNTAEYGGLEAGLTFLVKSGLCYPNLTMLGDSKLIVMQVARRWQGKVSHLLAARERVHDLLAKLVGNWEIWWIPREQNTEADMLSKAVTIPKERL